MSRTCYILWIAQRILCEILILHPKLIVSSKKKSHYLNSVSDFLLFVRKSRCSLKKSLPLGSVAQLSNFIPNQYSVRYIKKYIGQFMLVKKRARCRYQKSHRFPTPCLKQCFHHPLYRLVILWQFLMHLETHLY